MAVQHNALFGAATAIALLGLAGCADSSTGSAANTTECVDIADGDFFVVEDGRLTATNAPVAEVIETIVEAPVGWASTVEKSFSGLGFPWMGLRVRENVATLTGLAPDAAAKERAFEAGEAAIYANTEGADQVTIVVDGIAVEGGDAGVGASLATLSDGALSVASCQQAFDGTMQGRFVQFPSGGSVIRRDSARLLDAVTGVAILCKDYLIEVGGHTDASGPDAINMQLSQQRANSVRTYLIRKGVAAETLKAVGYGETRPLVDSHTAAAYRANRRTEFKVTSK
jgi:outer membrane protein OmpA-like peptidoglycan-associated protein